MSLKQNLQQRFKGQDSGALSANWPSIPAEDRMAVLGQLDSRLGNIKLPKKETEDRATSDAVFMTGVNAVTRVMEAHSADAAWPVGVVVVANRGVRPPMLLQHILLLAASRRIPIVALGVDSVALGEILGLKRLLTLAVKKDEASANGLCQFLVKHGTVPNVTWAKTVALASKVHRKRKRGED